MENSIQFLSLRLCYSDSLPGEVFPEIWFQPETISRVITCFTIEYRTAEKVKSLLQNLKLLNEFPLPNNESLTSNDSHIYIRERDQVTFDVEYVTELKPVTLHLNDVLYLFEKYRDFLHRYETCQIPGLIPCEKLGSWLCVPREQVKPEYLAALEAQSSV